mgnify:CR=1 FL=1
MPNDANGNNSANVKDTKKAAAQSKWDNWNGRVNFDNEPPEKPAEPEKKEKLTGKKWWQNFWFYYKVHTIVAAIVLILVGVTIYESTHKEKYDLTVVLATNGTTITEQEELIAELLSQYVEDYNGDGKVNVYVDVQNLPLDDPEASSEMFTAMQTRFAGELAVGEKSIYIMDQTLYDYYEVAGSFNDLSEKYPGVDGIDGDKFSLAWLFKGEPLLEEYMPECFLLERDSQYMTGYKKEKVQKDYECGERFIDNLINGNIVTPLKNADGESSLVSEAPDA